MSKICPRNLFSHSLKWIVKTFKIILMGKIPHDKHIPVKFQP